MEDMNLLDIYVGGTNDRKQVFLHMSYSDVGRRDDSVDKLTIDRVLLVFDFYLKVSPLSYSDDSSESLTITQP